MTSQAARLLSIQTPLGKDAVLLEAFEGEEALSEPFEFRLDLLSESPDIDPNVLVGRSVGFQVRATADEPARRFHGIVRALSRGDFAPSGLSLIHI